MRRSRAEGLLTAKKQSKKVSWQGAVLACIYTPTMILQFVLFFFFYYNHMGIDVLLYVGWFLWGLSIIFGIVPMHTFRKKGGVRKGKSYIHTTKLVDTGIYSIVRHPQYLAGFLLIIALMLLTQHWLCIIAGMIALVAFYVDTLRADAQAIEKFGREYKRYMRRVPRLNFVLGITRRLYARR